jgi:four helix bundle protein
MNPEEFKKRTQAYALRIVRLASTLPNNAVCRVIGGQLVKAGTSVGANYRASCRAKSAADFRSKMGIVEEECDESLYWMEVLILAGIVSQKRLASLMQEGNEILAMTVSSINTSRGRR